MGGDSDIVHRISKDIDEFYENLDGLDAKLLSRKAAEVVEMAKLYASDARSYLAKNDTHTAFSCISYAHGLLDAVKEMQ
ncbi:MAG: DUF357 domain-containing protein [Candidatus Marsarchaeota archaeon]|nr:DUF357 domain-containing protein [Candidatus Marsarchaeota archaeon]